MPDTMTQPSPEDTARIAAAYHAAGKPKPKLVELPIGDIDADPSRRFRKAPGDIVPLGMSMRAIGLLHPIVVTATKPPRLISGQRRLLAALGLGWRTITARVLDLDDVVQAEHDENELRKNFTPSERVAIKQALADAVPDRRTAGLPNGGETGEVREDIIARRAGFASATVAARAEAVVEHGTELLRDAMDDGSISISAAAEVATLPDQVQDAVAKAPSTAKAVAKSVRAKAPEIEAIKAKPITTEEASEFVKAATAKHGRKPKPKLAAESRITPEFTRWTEAIKQLANAQHDDWQTFLDVLPSLNEDYLAEARRALPKLQAWLAALEHDEQEQADVE
jgi:ParB-like chromosome segregation protein Spo0J